jgi:uncharacterized protein (TIGR02300 family)
MVMAFALGALTAATLYGKARPRWDWRNCLPIRIQQFFWCRLRAAHVRNFMVKAEWGAKHGCPKCGTRFYDLGKDDPITCVECGYAWHADPVLKSKQPIPYEEVKKAEVVADTDLAEEDLDIDEDGDSPDNDVDLGGDDDLGVGVTDGDSDEN